MTAPESGRRPCSPRARDGNGKCAKAIAGMVSESQSLLEDAIANGREGSRHRARWSAERGCR